MTLATYTELKDIVQTTIARTDLNAYVQGWVRTGELLIQNTLRVREMSKVDATLTGTSGVVTLPTDFLAVNELRLATDLAIELTHEPTKQLFRREADAFGQGYGFWDIIGASLYIRPKPSDTQTYHLDYFAKPVALTETTQETNSIFPGYADLYLYGTLWRAFTHTRAFDKAERNKADLVATINLYNQQHIEEKEGTGPLQMCANMVA